MSGTHEQDGAISRYSSVSVFGVPLALIDFGLEGIFEDIAEYIFDGVFNIISDLFSETIGTLLKIEPSRLAIMQEMWNISVGAYFSLLTIIGLSYLGMFQLFPGSEKIDPYRFMGRALAATLSLIIINPPGDSTLFSQGAFGWALEITNILIEYFFNSMAPENYDIGASGYITAALGPWGLFSFGLLILLVVGILLLLMYIVLVAREMLILITFGLYPLLIVFWVTDFGPLKYGKQLSEKMFKATGMLIPLGVVQAAVFATTFQMMANGITGGDMNNLVQGTMVLLPVPVGAFMIITLTIGPLKMAGVGVGSVTRKASRSASRLGRRGSAILGAGAGGMMGGALPGGEDGVKRNVAPTDRSGLDMGQGDGTGMDRVAPELESTSIDYDETGGYQNVERRPQGRTRPDPYPQEAGSMSGEQDYSEPASLSDIDANEVSSEEFTRAFTHANPEERAQIVHEALQDGSKGELLLREAMGPVGGAIATAGATFVGLSGVGAAAAGAIPAGVIAYAGKEAIKNDSLRAGATNTWDAAGGLGKKAIQPVKNTFGAGQQSSVQASGGSDNSSGNNDNRFEK